MSRFTRGVWLVAFVACAPSLVDARQAPGIVDVATMSPDAFRREPQLPRSPAAGQAPAAVSPSLIENSANTALGLGALASNTTGYYNAALGNNALNRNTTGIHNTATGAWSLYSNTSGSYNTAAGEDALWSNIDGSENTGVGKAALYANTSGLFNTALGSQALTSNTTGGYNTAIGRSALGATTSGHYNTAVGNDAAVSNTLGIANTAVGYLSLQYNTDGDYNSAGGFAALRSNTTGWANTGYGRSALYSNTTGHSNTAVGDNAGYQSTTGSYNIYLGAEIPGAAGESNTMRLGLPYDSGTGKGQNRTFVAGVHGTVLTGPAVQVFVDANGQLGTLVPPAGTGTGTISIGAAQPYRTADLAQRLRTEEARNLVQQAEIADLRARLAQLERLVTGHGAAVQR